MKSQIGPPALAAELRRVAGDSSAPPASRADAVALLLGDVEAMSGRQRAAAAAAEVVSRIASRVRSAAAALRRFVTRPNPKIPKWKPPLLPGAPELKLVRVSGGVRGSVIHGSSELAAAFAFISLSHREAVWIGLLDNKHALAGIYMHTLGTAGASNVYPSEVLRVVLYSGLERFVMCHNHPSGDPTPSPDDIDITRRLIQGCTLLGNISMLDSLVVSHDGGKNGRLLAVGPGKFHEGPARFTLAEAPVGDIYIRYSSMADAGLMQR